MEILSKETLPFSGKFQHAASIIKHKGVLYAACFTGEFEGHPNCQIEIISKKEDKWKLEDTIKINQFCHWNPVLDVFDDTLHCWFHSGLFPTSWALHRKNMGTGRILTYPAGIIGPSRKANFLQYEGMWICPTAYETLSGWNIAIHVSDRRDLAKYPAATWQTNIPGIQPVVWREHGMWRMLARSKEGLISSETKDPRKWTGYELSFRHPNSGFDVEAGYIVLNNSEMSREHLMIGNEDSALDLEASWDFGTGEVSYPNALKDGGEMDVVYTGGRCNIVHARIKL